MAWDWFDRELADIKATLTRLEAIPEEEPTPPTPNARSPQGPKRHPQEPQETTGAGATGRAPTEPKPREEHAVAASSPAQTLPQVVATKTASLPTGADLSDPKNFGLLPPTANLEQGATSNEDYRKRLARDLAFANKVLHTSRVPAAIWREWRVFEKAVQERLRALTAQTVPVD